MAFSFTHGFDPRPQTKVLPKPKPLKPIVAPVTGRAAAPARNPRTALGALLPEGGIVTSAAPDVSWQDQTFLDSQSGIGQNLKNLQSYLINAGKATSADYGVDYDGDPTTGASNFRIADNVDVTNPFSRAALLKQSYQNTNRAISNGAGGSQLYSGARQNALNETGRQNLQAQDSLIKDFSGRFGGLYQDWLAGQGDATKQGLENTVAAQGRHQNDPVAPAPPNALAQIMATAPPAVKAAVAKAVAKAVPGPVTVKVASKAKKR